MQVRSCKECSFFATRETFFPKRPRTHMQRHCICIRTCYVCAARKTELLLKARNARYYGNSSKSRQGSFVRCETEPLGFFFNQRFRYLIPFMRELGLWLRPMCDCCLLQWPCHDQSKWGHGRPFKGQWYPIPWLRDVSSYFSASGCSQPSCCRHIWAKRITDWPMRRFLAYRRISRSKFGSRATELHSAWSQPLLIAKSVKRPLLVRCLKNIAGSRDLCSLSLVFCCNF